MILIFDIGKTNKKCFIFDEDYRIVFEKTTQLAETTDEDGDPCEDLDLLGNWIQASLNEILNDTRFQIRAINCTAYGASFVHLDATGQALTPLYNYLKPFPEDLRKQFFDTYGSEEKIALETASPILGSLNSGLQLYRLKCQNSLIFKQIRWSLHLPQYISFLVTNALVISKSPGELTQLASEITSIGCHTLLWDFRKNDYHDWVKTEGIEQKFPDVKASNLLPPDSDSQSLTAHPSIHIGPGLHDSSAALIPYLASFEEPFVLISTGTWCISLNPFNDEPLTSEELARDCLCYLTYEGKPVKAARYFGGYEHEQAVKKIAEAFGVSGDFYQEIRLSETSELSESYRSFMRQLVEKQAALTRLAIGRSSIRRIFVDGGFSKNDIYMCLLSQTFPDIEVFAAEIAQSTALGAAMVIHPFGNEKPLPRNLISIKKIRV